MKSCPEFLLLLVLFSFGEIGKSFGDGSGEESRRREWPSLDAVRPLEQDQCCVPGCSPECSTYDKRVAAATLAEAVANFPDLTNPDLQEEAPIALCGPSVRVKRSSSKICPDDMCIACSEELTDRLLSEGLITAANAQQIMKQNNPTGRNVTVRCDKYTFSKQPRFGAKIRSKEEADRIMQCIETSSNRDRWTRRGTMRPRRPRRTKRQTVGYSWSIGCLDRGEPERYGSQSTVVLCNTCWSWRVLPEDYHPRYLNELSCDADTKCLNGYGKCHQRTRNLDVLKNIGTASSPHWGSATVTLNTCCDCKINYGSALHSFISA